MNKKAYLFLCLVFLSHTFYTCALDMQYYPDSARAVHVNNRILAKINGKAISVIDVMKKMDVIFYQQYPDYAYLPSARYQFYQANWRHVLDELIDKELIMADAQEKHFNVSNGDIRQEMEELFGPQVMLSLDSIGLTYDEAWKIIASDITIRRMIMYQVHSKTINHINPKALREAYERYVQSYQKKEEWCYQMLTFRSNDDLQCSELASYAYSLLSSKEADVASLKDRLIAEKRVDDALQLNISPVYTQEDKELVSSTKEILHNLLPGTFSIPVVQKSRSDTKKVCRIFHLIEKKIDLWGL